jgi:Uma2 family endonuclease
MALLDTSELLSVEAYLEGELISDVKHEYLGGIVHAMAGGKMRHNKASVNVAGSLYSSLKGKACQPFNSDTKVRIQLPNQIRFYYPDVQVICDPVDDDTLFTDNPVVVVEVLSDSTRRLDVGEKRDAYLSVPSLKVLIIIDPAKVYVNVDRRRPLGGFDQEQYRGLDQMIELPEIEANLLISDIYEGIALK